MVVIVIHRAGWSTRHDKVDILVYVTNSKLYNNLVRKYRALMNIFTIFEHTLLYT